MDSVGEDEEPLVVKTDPEGRYSKYNEVLGQGAFKKVFRALDEVEGREVAWNEIPTASRHLSYKEQTRLLDEIEIGKTLHHRNIITFYDSWMDPETKELVFITELFTSGTLRQFRRRYHKLDMKAIKNWSRQVLEGLCYLHEHDPPIIHRDLKCDNIFINGHSGEVKIGDLGLATLLRKVNETMSVQGTPEFMAPEMYDEKYDEKVDIYAFGMCMFELVACEFPYKECENAAQIYRKVSRGILPECMQTIREKDPSTHAFISKCLKPHSQRPSARELLEDPFLARNDNHGGHSRRDTLDSTMSDAPHTHASVRGGEGGAMSPGGASLHESDGMPSLARVSIDSTHRTESSRTHTGRSSSSVRGAGGGGAGRGGGGGAGGETDPVAEMQSFLDQHPPFQLGYQSRIVESVSQRAFGSDFNVTGSPLPDGQIEIMVRMPSRGYGGDDKGRPKTISFQFDPEKGKTITHTSTHTRTHAHTHTRMGMHTRPSFAPPPPPPPTDPHALLLTRPTTRPCTRTLLLVDTAKDVAQEMATEFDLSTLDETICAAAIDAGESILPSFPTPSSLFLPLPPSSFLFLPLPPSSPSLSLRPTHKPASLSLCRDH